MIKREQRNSRKSYECEICKGRILENRDYIILTVQPIPGGERTRYRRHIHCDALIRLYAEEHHLEGDEQVVLDGLREWLAKTCRSECVPGTIGCRYDGQDIFSCSQLLWHLLRHKPGYGAIKKSIEPNAQGGE